MRKKLNILNVSSCIGLHLGGGEAERTFQMSKHLASAGHNVNVLTLDIDLAPERIRQLLPANLHALPSMLSRFKIPRSGWGKIVELVEESDVVHLIGHWSLLNCIVFIAARKIRRPYVVCAAGSLPIFGRSKMLKKIYNFIIGNRIVRHASRTIAVTRDEVQDYIDYQVGSELVVVIPNGVDTSDFPVVDLNPFRSKFGIRPSRSLLFMGRLNIIKGPDLLLNAFIEIQGLYPDLQLIFAGPDGGMLADLKKAVKSSGIDDVVHFLGHVSGTDKIAAYRNASLLVVPSRSEAMSIVALEAGVCGIPVVMTDKCGFDEIKSIDERLEVGANSHAIVKGLNLLLKDEASLEVISRRWEAFVVNNYSWKTVLNLYETLYRRVISEYAIK